MRENTDLQAVKNIALCYLRMPIKTIKDETDLVSHPIATGKTHIYEENGEIKVEILEKGSDDYKRWVARWETTINECTTAFSVFMIINKSYKYSFMKHIKQYLNRHDFSEIFSWAWTSTENPNMNPEASVKQNVTYFMECDPDILMQPEELAVFNNLPDSCTVYRGVTTYNQDNIKALSWTLNEDVAEWFATRCHQAGQVYSAKIQKEHVLAYFCCRSEEELVIDPEYLQNIELHTQFVKDDKNDIIAT